MFSLAYVALGLVFANERRLLAVDNELEIARNIQIAILPRGVPPTRNLRMSATYRPMTAVAGDFYEFVPVDEARLGILVADVAGHGVPAALIASRAAAPILSSRGGLTTKIAALAEQTYRVTSDTQPNL